MLREVHLKNGVKIALESKSFASGGEGDLYRIISPSNLTNQVVKIYKKDKRSKEREDKLIYLIKNRPVTSNKGNHNFIIWVNELVYEKNVFCGFCMFYVSGIKLELLCLSNLPKTLPVEWKKFDFSSNEALKLRLRLCFNVAVAVYHIHKIKSFVIVDLKPENIIVQSNGLISIIDLDSIAVIKENRVIFPAPVSTPDYTPAEYNNEQNQTSTGINETWDRFSMAIIFYRLLCGIHPFIGTCFPPYDKSNTTYDKIKKGLFVNGIKSSSYNIIPAPHRNFYKLKNEVQNLFKLCFDGGYVNPSIRPTPDDWCRVLSTEDVIRPRKLPSEIISFPDYKMPTSYLYSPPQRIEWVKLVFPKIKSQPLANLIFSKIFGVSNRDKFILSIKIKMNELIDHENNLFLMISKHNSIHLEFIKNQTTIIENGLLEIKNQINLFTIKMVAYDNSFKELINNENSETLDVINKFNIEKTLLSNKIKDIYSVFLEDKENKYNLNSELMQSKLSKVITDKNEEEIKRINNPSKLIQYKLNRADIHNFGFSTIKALETVGIKTAADFVDIDANGSLRRRNGNWVKANGVGWTRANELLVWKHKLDLKENSIIKKEIKSMFENKISTIQQEIGRQEKEFKEYIKPYQLKYNEGKSEIDIKLKEITQKYNAKLNEIKQKYDKYSENSYQECRSYIKNKLQIVLDEVLKGIKNKIDTNFRNFEKAVSDLTDKIAILKNNIITNYSEFSSEFNLIDD